MTFEDLDFGMLDDTIGQSEKLILPCGRCCLPPTITQNGKQLACIPCGFTIIRPHPNDARNLWNLTNNSQGIDLTYTRS